MDKIQWGIVGCGNVTEIKSGPAFNKVDDSTLVAVMRRDPILAENYAARHNVPKWYNNASDLINDTDVNAIYIATPPSSHEEYALAAIRAGKPVYVEKPMSMNAESANKIAEEAAKNNVRLCVAHYRREMPIFKAVKRLIDEGTIGTIRSANIQYSQPYDRPGFEPAPENWRLQPSVSGGGIFHDLAPHQLDLMYYFFGSPESISGTAFNQAGYYEADDVVAGTMRFANNIIFNGNWCFTSPITDITDSCTIIGSEGSLQFGIFKMEKIIIQLNDSVKELSFEPLQHVQQPMIQEVVRYFLGERSNPCSGYDGAAVMHMIDSFVN